jgi:hypothetical protein
MLKLPNFLRKYSYHLFNSVKHAGLPSVSWLLSISKETYFMLRSVSFCQISGERYQTDVKKHHSSDYGISATTVNVYW